MPEKVLLVGNNVRNVAQSAKKAGYSVIAVTKYADADLEIYCERVYSFSDPGEAAEIAESVAQAENAKVVLCSGCEMLRIDAELMCNEPGKLRDVVDKLRFYRRLERAGIPHPELVDEGPGIVKPRIGGGGEEVRLADSAPDGFILQRYVAGVPCSISLIAGEEVIPIAANLMLAGWREMNADGFRYAGNVTPVDLGSEAIRELERVAVETVELFDLTGSVGVDFIYADKPYVLEINPRFQGSLDSIEWSCDVNLFSLHVSAFEGGSVEKPKPARFAARAVLFADRSVRVSKNLAGNPFFADVPKKGERYERGDPLVSILASGKSREEVLAKVVGRRDAFLKLACGR